LNPWYVVHCKPKSEHIALANLERQGFVCYLPMLKVYAPRKATLVRQEVMFPRYLFCQTATSEQSIAPIRSTLGVLTLVRFGSQPAVLSHEIITQIRGIEAMQQARGTGDLSGLQAGASVRVVSGPLATLEGIVNTVADGRINILFELIGKPTSMTLDLTQVRAVL
jgi:transcriptional antiterminator RfaH